MFRPVFRYLPACFLFALGIVSGAAPGKQAPATGTAPSRALATPLQVRTDSLRALAAARVADSLRVRDSLHVADSLHRIDSVRAVRRSLHEDAPDSTYRWPQGKRVRNCVDPLESVGECWRQEPRWALQENGFPGLRTGALDLRSLEPLRVTPFYSGATSPSPYRTGGLTPFRRYEDVSGPEEAWLPVQPLDTPVTDLHWMRGALFLNQFTLRMERMVGNRAYLGLEYHSDGAESQPYQYAFQVHQPYLGPLNRDSLSLVIEDTSHAISARQVRPRLGFWLSPRDVVEFYGDFVTNETSLNNPGNPMARDSAQLLYPASFTGTTFGVVGAHNGPTHQVQGLVRHASWNRVLKPRLTSRVENADGTIDFGRVDWTLPALPGEPRLRFEAQNAFTDNAFYLGAVTDSALPASSARDDLEKLEVSARPAFGPVEFSLRGDGTRRARADGRVEWLGGAGGAATLDLPWGFRLEASAGSSREGAPDDLLFRWQPAFGLYPNSDLTPRTLTSWGAGAGWSSRHLGFGAGLDATRLDDTWLPRTLPDAFSGSLADSLSLAQTNVPYETRTAVHLSAYGAVGNWKLSLWNTALIRNVVHDSDAATRNGRNPALPKQVMKGQLLWKRRILDDKLGLQTQWDWEWFSQRTVWASDMDGTSRPLTLDEYLVLDFTARMEIKTFMLYFRAMNLNHDRYATEAGVHPPGVNFRFGVDWRIRN